MKLRLESNRFNIFSTKGDRILRYYTTDFGFYTFNSMFSLCLVQLWNFILYNVF